jgi:hypothetical protein
VSVKLVYKILTKSGNAGRDLKNDRMQVLFELRP